MSKRNEDSRKSEEKDVQPPSSATSAHAALVAAALSLLPQGLSEDTIFAKAKAATHDTTLAAMARKSESVAEKLAQGSRGKKEDEDKKSRGEDNDQPDHMSHSSHSSHSSHFSSREN